MAYWSLTWVAAHHTCGRVCTGEVPSSGREFALGWQMEPPSKWLRTRGYVKSTFKPKCTNMDFHEARVADSITPEGNWNTDLLAKATPPKDSEVIKKIPLNLRIEDKLIWHFDRLGMYSVKSGYKWFQKSRLCTSSTSKNISKILWTKTWKLNVPPQIRHFIWRALKNILPTRTNLLKKGIEILPYYPIYGKY